MKTFRRREILLGASAGIIAATPTFRGTKAQARDKVSLKVSYAGPTLKIVHDEIARRFAAGNPDIAIQYTPPVRSYEELIQNVLRGSIVGDVPDIAFHTLGSMRIFEARKLAAPLNKHVMEDANFTAGGYLPSMLKMGYLNDNLFSLPFEVSAPAIFYNVDLVKRAGGDPAKLPDTWEQVISLVRKISDLGNNITGGHFEYDQSGAWMLQALVMSHSGRVLNQQGTAIGFDNEVGLQAFRILRTLGEKGLVDMSRDQARQVFSSGKLGVLVTSSSILDALEKQASGNFEVGVGAFPIPSETGGLPAGGNAAVVHAKDPQRIAAAWEYIKFAIGPIGQAVSITNTGYLPVNGLALSQGAKENGTAKSENYKKSVAILPKLIAPTEFPGENAVRITKRMMEYMQIVISLKQDPEIALREMTKEINALLV